MDFPAGNLITAVTAIVAVVVGNKLAYSRSSEEKVWDLRRQAYGVILAELAAVERICDYADELIAQDELRYFHGDHHGVHQSQVAEHIATVRQRFSEDYLIISETFITLVERFFDELGGGSPNEAPPEEHERISATVRESRLRLMAQARSEITFQKSWWTRLYRWVQR